MKKNIIAFSTIFVFISILFTSYAFSISDEESIYLARIEEGIRYNRTNPYKPYTTLTDEKIISLNPLFLDIFRKEKELAKDYYQVITGQNSIFLCYQIILKELHQILENKKFTHYEFLRDSLEKKYQNLSEFFSVHPNLLKFDELIKQLENNDRVDINNFVEEDIPEMSERLISASLTMETCTFLESAQYIFANGSGLGKFAENKEYLNKLITAVFDRRGIPSAIYEPYINEWMEMLPKSDEGIIVQIFIHKTFVDDLLYVSFPKGLRLTETNDLITFFHNFNKSRLTRDFDIFACTQARVLIDALSPENAQIFRYSVIDPEKIKGFTLFIRKCLYEILEIAGEDYK
jgi:hypothetical protein